MSELNIISSQQIAQIFASCPAVQEHLNARDLSLATVFNEGLIATQYLHIPSQLNYPNNTLWIRQAEWEEMHSGPFPEHLLDEKTMQMPAALLEKDKPVYLYLLSLFTTKATSPFFESSYQMGFTQQPGADSYFSLSEYEEFYYDQEVGAQKKAQQLALSCEESWQVDLKKNKTFGDPQFLETAHVLVQHLLNHDLTSLRNKWAALISDDYCSLHPNDLYSCQIEEIFSTKPEVALALWFVAYQTGNLKFSKLSTQDLTNAIEDVLGGQKNERVEKAFDWLDKNRNHPSVKKLRDSFLNHEVGEPSG